MKRFLSLLVVIAPLSSAQADKTFNAGTGTTWDCAKDADVTINTSNGKYTFKGACKDINVNGSGLTLTIESVEDLTVNGAKNTVNVSASDDININGTDNTVTWGKGIKGAAPKVSTLGTGNKVSGGGAVSASTSTTAGAPAQANATVLDCSKKKNAAITKSNGVYAVTGACDKVALSGSNNIVTIESTKNLAVSGGSNTVTVTAVDKIAATGKNNTVTWTAGLSGKPPKTASSGKNNTIAQGGAALSTAATNGATTTTATTTTVAAGAIDCSKTKKHTIATNDGTYTYVGECELIRISGNNNTLKVEKLVRLEITGNENKADVTALDQVSVPGNDNTVRWNKTITEKKRPRSSFDGNGNNFDHFK